MENLKDKVLDALKEVVDPELGINVVDLGLIYAVAKDGKGVRISMTATTPFCPYLPQLVEQVEGASRSIEGIETAEVTIVWSPPWNTSMLSVGAKAQLGIM